MRDRHMHTSVMTEADTCRELVTHKLVESGCSAAPHAIREANQALIPATLERLFSPMA